jgi:2-polyprenyl-6-methoxyphenol hydroxylase-like FAD-dependent oxidoreductase
VGGGPAGLYFAILVKQFEARNQVTVLERKPFGANDGWGVVFWDDLVADLRASDAETADRIGEHAYRWHGQRLDLDGAPVETANGHGFAIARWRLRDILSARAAEVGVDIQFDHEVTSVADLHEADIIVACDGVNSVVRQHDHERFGTHTTLGRNKYVWLGTPKVFDTFTFGFVRTDAGWIWCHAYAFDPHTSTCIVECPPETWTGLGFDARPSQDSLNLLEKVFAAHLDGEPLLSPTPTDANLPWLNFRTVTNQRWHAGNTVLMGDAAHTLHFSIGSGTRLALQDAIALTTALQRNDTPQSAFAAYESERRGALLRPQTEARFSAQWFENISRYINLPAPAVFALLRARRDPILPHVSPTMYYRLYNTAENITVLRKLRGWLGPRARTLYSHRPSRMRSTQPNSV